MPAFRVAKPKRLLAITSDLDVPGSTFDIPWDSIVTEGDWSGSSSTSHVLARDGFWLLNLRGFVSAGTSNQNRTYAILVNGVEIAGSFVTPSTAARPAVVTAALDLDAGDVVGFQVQTATSGGHKLTPPTAASLARMGPKSWR